MKFAMLFAATIVMASGNLSNENESSNADPENSISDVMKKGHAGGGSLLSKVKKDEATDEEKMELLNLYIDMLDNEPPKGDKDEWEALNQRIVVAAAKVALGREDSTEALVELTNCKNCHDSFK